jgi:hypothetical protein
MLKNKETIMNKLRLLLIVISSAIIGSAFAAETVYVSSRSAKIYQQATFDSEVITRLERDSEVNVIEHSGIWINVNNVDISGWVSRYSMTSAKPFKEKISILSKIKFFLGGGSNRDRMTLVSTAGGVRGLSADDSESAGKKDFKAVEKMESIQISELELEQFVTGNKP